MLGDCIKAFTIASFACAILAFCLNKGPSKQKEEPAAFILIAPESDALKPKPEKKQEDKKDTGGKTHEASLTPVTPSAPIASISTTSSDVAAICAQFDPVQHPEQILDILEFASQQSCRMIKGKLICTSVGELYAIWRIETGHVDGAGFGSGKCAVMPELARRCQHKHAGNCKVDDETGRPVNCTSPKSCHYFSMETLAKRFDWDLQRMTCSCPKGVDVIDPQTGQVIGKKKKGFGGCCGPFQFSGAEIDEWALEMNLDPMTFCGGAVIAAMDLLERYERIVTKKGVPPGDRAKQLSISSYYGNDPEAVYYAKALSRWKKFASWQACEVREGPDGIKDWFRKSNGERCDEAALERQQAYVRSQLAKQATDSVEYFRSLRDYYAAHN